MRRFIERSIEDLIAGTIIDAYPKKLIGINLDIENDEIKISSI